MSLDYKNIIEIVVSCCSFILFFLFFMTIKKNGENIFISMRSANLMQITNLSIFLSILLYSISDIFYSNLEKHRIPSFILSFYFLFQLIIFVSLLLRYHRLYISCKTTSIVRDDFLQVRYFEAKSYHYEYFYVRFMAVFIFILLTVTSLYFFLSDENKENIMFNYEILLANVYEYSAKDIPRKNHYFWIFLSFIETFVFMTYALLIIKTHLNPKVNISYEIILVSFVNYLYYLSIGLSFLDKNTINKNMIYIFPLLYNLLIYFVSIGLPFLWARYNETVINYDLPGELASSLYLFLTKEKCFDLFYNFLYNQGINRDKGIYYLDMLINIFKYRMLILSEQPADLIVEEMDNIDRIYLTKNDVYNYFDANLVKQMKDACRDNRDNPRINIFDPITNVIYDYLDMEFQRLTKTEEFESLKNDLTQETYVRCKLANYGLIRN